MSRYDTVSRESGGSYRKNDEALVLVGPFYNAFLRPFVNILLMIFRILKWFFGVISVRRAMDYLELTWSLLFVHAVVFVCTISFILRDKIRERANEDPSVSYFAKSFLKEEELSKYDDVLHVLSVTKITLRSLCFTFALLRFVGTKTREEKAVTERESWLGYFLSNAFTSLWPSSPRGSLAMLCFVLSRGVVENMFFIVQYLERLDKNVQGTPIGGICEALDMSRSIFLKSIVILGLFVGHRYITSESKKDDFQRYEFLDEERERYRRKHLKRRALSGHSRRDFGRTNFDGTHTDTRLNDRFAAHTAMVRPKASPMSGNDALPRQSMPCLSSQGQKTMSSLSYGDIKNTETNALSESSDYLERPGKKLSKERAEIENFLDGVEHRDPDLETQLVKSYLKETHMGVNPQILGHYFDQRYYQTNCSKERADNSRGRRVQGRSSTHTLAEAGNHRAKRLSLPASKEPTRSPRVAMTPENEASPSLQVDFAPNVLISGVPSQAGDVSRDRLDDENLRDFLGSADEDAASKSDGSPQKPDSASEMENSLRGADGTEMEVTASEHAKSEVENGDCTSEAGLRQRRKDLKSLCSPGVDDPLIEPSEVSSDSEKSPKSSSGTLRNWIYSNVFGTSAPSSESKADALKMASSPRFSDTGILTGTSPDRLAMSGSRTTPSTSSGKRPTGFQPSHSGASAADYIKKYGRGSVALSSMFTSMNSIKEPNNVGVSPKHSAPPMLTQQERADIRGGRTSKRKGKGYLDETSNNWFLIQPRKPWQPRQLWRKLRFCIFGLDPFSQSLKIYATYFGAFVLGCSLLECLCEVFVFKTVSFDVWVGRRLITGNWRHAVYATIMHPLESVVIFFLFRFLQEFMAVNESQFARLLQQLSRGLMCFGLILMSHRVCSGLLSFFIMFECKHLSNEVAILLDKWRTFTRKQRQQRYQKVSDTIRYMDKKLFLIIHFVFSEHIVYMVFDLVDHNCSMGREKNMGLYMIRHCIGGFLSCVALWHAGVVNYAIYEGVWGKVQHERLHLRDDQILYRKELKDWASYLGHGARFSRTICIRLFFLRYALTSNMVTAYFTTLILWPMMAKTFFFWET